MPTKAERAQKEVLAEKAAQLFLAKAPIAECRKVLESWFDVESYEHLKAVYDDVRECEVSPQEAAKDHADQWRDTFDEEVGGFLMPEGMENDDTDRFEAWLKENWEALTDGVIDNWATTVADDLEYSKSPMAYYGVKQSDFL